MDTAHEPGLPTLPSSVRLLHIGLAKTGTTALQSTARAKREELLGLGVRYPGTGLNHREAVSALMGRRWGWSGPDAIVPPMRRWDQLMAEVEAEGERRIWLSHEFVSESDDETAQRFAEALGPRLHIAVTLRPYSAILASSWQQYLKGGTTHTFEHWLKRVLRDEPDLKITPSFHRRNDQAGVVQRWASVVGPANVTAIVVDKARPTFLTRSFEQLLGLPDGFLADSSPGGLQANRSMSWPESELLRALNLMIKKQGVTWAQYEALVRDGAIARLLQSRTPPPTEDRVLLPPWAAERATVRGRQFADAIAASGVNVTGDLEVLAAPVTATADIPPVPADVPLEVATEALAGLLSAAVGRGPCFETVPSKTPGSKGVRASTAGSAAGIVAASQGAARPQAGVERMLARTSTGELAGVLARRVRLKAARLLGLRPR